MQSSISSVKLPLASLSVRMATLASSTSIQPLHQLSTAETLLSKSSQRQTSTPKRSQHSSLRSQSTSPSLNIQTLSHSIVRSRRTLFSYSSWSLSRVKISSISSSKHAITMPQTRAQRARLLLPPLFLPVYTPPHC